MLSRVWLPLAALAFVLWAPAPAGASGAERVIRVQAGNFAFTPGSIRVQTGERVTLEIIAADVAHGVYVDGYDVQATAEPGQTARLTFTADRPGVFRLRCSVTCGALHPFMLGRLEVGPAFSAWRLLAAAVITAAAAFHLARPRPAAGSPRP